MYRSKGELYSQSLIQNRHLALRRPTGAPVGPFGAQAPQNEKKEQNLMQAVPRLGPATWTGGGKAGAPVWAVLEKRFSIFSGFEPVLFALKSLTITTELTEVVVTATFIGRL